MRFLLSSVLLVSASALAAAAPQSAAQPTVQPTAQDAAAASRYGRPSEERLALARQLLDLTMPVDSELQQMKDMSVQIASIRTGDDDGDDPAEVADFVDRLIVKGGPVIHMHMLSIREVTAHAYAREFSPAELQTMISFAATPAGKHYFAREHFVDLDPGIIAQDMLLRDALKPIVSDIHKEMCQERTARRIAAGDKKAKCPLADKPDTAAG